jgi:hypothetical protein
MIVCFIFIIFYLSYSVGSRIDDSITFEDIVKSNLLYLRRSASTITKYRGHFSPTEYLELESIGINLYSNYRSFCVTLDSKDSWDKKYKELGKDSFEKIVDGECLSLGPFEWMPLDMIKTIHTPPLYLAPAYLHSQLNGIDQAKFSALIEATVRFGKSDTFGFLCAIPDHLKMFQKHFESQPEGWKSPHWSIFSYVGVCRSQGPNLKKFLLKMLPPVNEFKSHTHLCIQQVIRYLGLVSEEWRVTEVKDHLNFIATFLDSIPSGKPIANFIEGTKTPGDFKLLFDTFQHYPSIKEFLVRIYQIKPEELSDSDQIRLLQQPTFFTPGKPIESFPIPNYFLKAARDGYLWLFMSRLLDLFSVDSQVSFISYTFRELHGADVQNILDIRKSSSLEIFGNIVSQSAAEAKVPGDLDLATPKDVFPSKEFFNKVLDYLARNIHGVSTGTTQKENDNVTFFLLFHSLQFGYQIKPTIEIERDSIINVFTNFLVRIRDREEYKQLKILRCEDSDEYKKLICHLYDVDRTKLPDKGPHAPSKEFKTSILIATRPYHSLPASCKGTFTLDQINGLLRNDCRVFFRDFTYLEEIFKSYLDLFETNPDEFFQLFYGNVKRKFFDSVSSNLHASLFINDHDKYTDFVTKAKSFYEKHPNTDSDEENTTPEANPKLKNDPPLKSEETSEESNDMESETKSAKNDTDDRQSGGDSGNSVNTTNEEKSLKMGSGPLQGIPPFIIPLIIFLLICGIGGIIFYIKRK